MLFIFYLIDYDMNEKDAYLPFYPCIRILAKHEEMYQIEISQ